MAVLCKLGVDSKIGHGTRFPAICKDAAISECQEPSDSA